MNDQIKGAFKIFRAPRHPHTAPRCGCVLPFHLSSPGAPCRLPPPWALVPAMWPNPSSPRQCIVLGCLVENRHSHSDSLPLRGGCIWGTAPRHRPHLRQRHRLLPPRGLSTAKVPEGAAVQEFNLDRNAKVGGVLIRGKPAAGLTEPALRNR